MRIALVSDIHSNLVALETVLQALPAHDQLWCLGDTIGYGPRPNECLPYMRERATNVLTGNHDLACLGEVSLVDFNAMARTANQWNNRQLLPELRAYLHERPATLTVAPSTQRWHMPAHAIRSGNIFWMSKPLWTTCLLRDTDLSGRTHACSDDLRAPRTRNPRRFRGGPAEADRPASGRLALYLQSGQRRTATRRRSTRSLCDLGYRGRTIRFERVAYDIAATQRQMRTVGLPPMLSID